MHATAAARLNIRGCIRLQRRKQTGRKRRKKRRRWKAGRVGGCLLENRNDKQSKRGFGSEAGDFREKEGRRRRRRGRKKTGS